MSANVEPIDWNELPDLMTIEELRRFTRQGDRQARRFAKEEELEVRLGNSVRVSKAALRRYLQQQVQGKVFEEDAEDGKVMSFPPTIQEARNA